MTIANGFGYNGDDSISVKTSDYAVPPRASYGIRISGNVLWTVKVAFRIGTESRADMHDILFEDNGLTIENMTVAGKRMTDLTEARIASRSVVEIR